MSFEEYIAEQKVFSEKTFGPGYATHRIIDHIKRELIEIEAKPQDWCEWIDIAMLAIDAAWRCGASPRQIAVRFWEKLAINQRRLWPDWRTSDPDKAMEHIREVCTSNDDNVRRA